MEQSMFDLGVYFPLAVARMSQMVSQYQFSGHKVGKAIFVLGLVGLRENCSMTEVVDQLQIPPSTATRYVDQLFAKKLVERIIPEENRRTVTLRLTKTGHEVYTNFRSHQLLFYQKILEGIEADHLGSIILALKRIVEVPAGELGLER